MLNWCLKLDCLFPEAVQIIEMENNLKKVNNSFINRLRYSNIIQYYPNDVTKLLISILNSGAKIDNIEYSMSELINKLDITDKTLVTKLNEALLRRHITLTIM